MQHFFSIPTKSKRRYKLTGKTFFHRLIINNSTKKKKKRRLNEIKDETTIKKEEYNKRLERGKNFTISRTDVFKERNARFYDLLQQTLKMHKTNRRTDKYELKLNFDSSVCVCVCVCLRDYNSYDLGIADCCSCSCMVWCISCSCSIFVIFLRLSFIKNQLNFMASMRE